MKKPSEIYFWEFSIVTIFGIPLLVALIYEHLGGGLLGGIWGASSRTFVIHPDLLRFINPILAIIPYGFMCVEFKKYLQISKRNYVKVVFASCVMVLATLIVAAIVFWSAIT